MVTMEIPTKLTMDDLLAAIDKLPNQALLEFGRRVRALETKRCLATVEVGDEQALLQVIAAQRLPDSDQKRLAWLREKSDDETLTSEEHAELLHYVQRVGQHDLTRVEALIELAQKRGVTLREVMRQLGIEPAYAWIARDASLTSCCL